MKEYTEREAVVKEIKDYALRAYDIDLDCPEQFGGSSKAEQYCEGLFEAIEIVEATPAADVVERKRGEWVSVEERLPNIHQRVLVWCESKTIQKHVTTCTFMADYSGKGKGPHFSRHVRNVTHWMPLPEPPNCGADMRSHHDSLCDQEEGEA